MSVSQGQRVTTRLPLSDLPAGLVAEAAHARYATGETLAEIATAFQVSWEEAAGWLREHGTFRTKIILSPRQVEELEARTIDQGSATGPAEHLGLTPDGLATLLGRRKRTHGPVDELATVSTSQREEITRRYVGGHTITRLAADCGLTVKTLTTILGEAGVDLRPGDEPESRRRPSAAKTQRLVARYREGIPVGALAREMSLWPSIVEDTLRAQGVHLPTPEEEAAGLSQDRRVHVLACCADGLSAREVADLFAIMPRTVHLLLHEQSRDRAPASAPVPGLRKVQPTGVQKTRELRDRGIAAHFRDGLPVDQIAARFELSAEQVTVVLQQAGLLARPAPQEPRKKTTRSRSSVKHPRAPRSSATKDRPRLGEMLEPPPLPDPPRPPVDSPSVSLAAAGPLFLAPGQPSPDGPDVSVPIAPANPGSGRMVTRALTPGLPRMFTEEQADEIVERYRAGESTVRLARAFGVTDPTISKALRARHVRLRPPARPSVDADTEQAILTAYRAGTRQRELARQFGVGRGVIDGVLDRHHEPRRGSRRALSGSQIDEAVNRYRAGESMAAIAADLGVSEGSVSNALALRQVPKRSRTAHLHLILSEQDADLAIGFYQQGEPVEEIARALNVTPATVQRVLDARQPLAVQPGPSEDEATTQEPTATSVRPTVQQPDVGAPATPTAARIPSRFTEQQADEIAARYQAGESTVVLARAFQTYPGVINQTLRARNVPRRDRNARWHDQPRTANQPVTPRLPRGVTEEQADEIAARYQAGESSTQLAHALGRNDDTVRRVLRARNITLRHGRQHQSMPPPRTRPPSLPKTFTEQQADEIAARYQAGESTVGLARAFDTNPDAINRVLQVRGIPRRPRRAPRLLSAPNDTPEPVPAEPIATGPVDPVAVESVVDLTLPRRHRRRTAEHSPWVRSPAGQDRQEPTEAEPREASSSEIRKWARATGLAVPARGPLPAAVLRQFQDAFLNGTVPGRPAVPATQPGQQRRHRRRPPHDSLTARQAREWAQANDIPVPTRGPVPAAVMAQYVEQYVADVEQHQQDQAADTAVAVAQPPAPRSRRPRPVDTVEPAPEPPPVLLADAEILAVVQRLLTGSDVPAIAREFDLPETAIRETLQHLGEGHRPPRVPDAAPGPHVRAMEAAYAAGAAVHQALGNHRHIPAASSPTPERGTVQALPRRRRQRRSETLSQDDTNTIVLEFVGNVPIDRIAAEHKVSQSKVIEVLLGRGVPTGMIPTGRYR